MSRRTGVVILATVACLAGGMVVLNAWGDRVAKEEERLARERGLPPRHFWQPRPLTAFSAAAANGDLAALRAQLRAGTSPDAVEGRGWTALMWAARAGRVASIELLVAHGVDLEQPDERNGWTPLFHAIHTRQPAAVRALLAAGADIEARTKAGATPLILAAGEGQREIVETLLAAGADPYACGSHGLNALITAEMSGEPEVKRALLRAAPDLARHTDQRALWLARKASWALSFLPQETR